MKSPLTEEELNGFRQRLEKMRKSLAGDLEKIEQEAFGKPGAPLDQQGDRASISATRELDLGLLEQDELTLKQVMAAITRIELGQFGICDACEAPISEERLDVLPYASHCAACAR